ncbi:MAG: hypothetical protein NUV56_02095 [Candidatus Uhrbacteria bacterium]|nr:hypothetical protein [Candidatus Uhrbacteria bacterium]
MESQRSWFPFILAGVTILLTAAFILVDDGKIGGISTGGQEEIATPTVTEGSYKTAVTAILSTYATDRSASATYNALILLRVPPVMQQLHFDLVVAFGKLVTGDEEDGAARLSALKAQYPWLPL